MKFLDRRNFLLLFAASIVLAIVVRPELFGKYLKADSEKRFDKYLGKYELIVVLFYALDKNMKKEQPELYERVKNHERMLKTMSERRKYKEGDLHFLVINTSKKKAGALALDYQIAELPTFLLFKNGIPVRDNQGKVISLTGFAQPDQLDDFIEKHFEDRMEEITEQKEEERKRRLEERRYRSLYYGPYWWGGYGYPYYWGGGYPYYRRYPYGGFGFSFGW